MAHIVLISKTIRSTLIKLGEMGRRLRLAGHRVTFVLPPGDDVSRSGIEHETSALGFESLAKRFGDAARSGTPGWRNALRDAVRPRTRSRGLVAGVDIAAFHAQLARLAPDLVLIDIEAHEHVIAAARAGHRVALIDIFFNLWKRPSAPPLHLPITPGRGLAGSRMGIEIAWLRYRLWRLRTRLRARLRGDDYESLLEAYAERVGYPLGCEVDRFQGLLPFVYRHLPVLNLNLLELDLPHEPPPNVHYVGPMTAADGDRPDFDARMQPVREALDALAAHVAGHAARRLVYCGFGAYFPGDAAPEWRPVIEAAALRPDWTFVLGLGDRFPPSRLGELPSNVRAFEWVPQMYALEKADCAIVHGGVTSLYECLRHAVPMVVYPYAQIFDQFGNAARVEFHGLGLVGQRGRDTPQAIVARVARVMEDAEVGPRLRRMREHVRRYDSEARLAAVVALILAQDPGHGAATRERS